MYTSRHTYVNKTYIYIHCPQMVSELNLLFGGNRQQKKKLKEKTLLHAIAVNLEIRILSRHIMAHFVGFDLPIWTLKSDITRGNYELSDSLGRCCFSLHDFCHNLLSSFMSLALNFKIQLLSCYIIAHFVSFDLPIWTLKPDITRGSYELSDLPERSKLSLHDFCHKYTFSFLSVLVNLEIRILSRHIIAHFVGFNSPIWTLKSDITWGSYELPDSRGRPCLLSRRNGFLPVEART